MKGCEMKLNQLNDDCGQRAAARNLTGACLASCQKAHARVKRAKDAIFAESRAALGAHEHLLRLALNEAEALAWQTAYPHLVFPDLATEKVRAVIAWDSRQQARRHSAPMAMLAA